MVDVREVDPLGPIWPVRPGDQRNSKRKPAANPKKESSKDDDDRGDDDQHQPHVDTYA